MYVHTLQTYSAAPAPLACIGPAAVDLDEGLRLVRQLAGTLIRRLPAHVELAELISLGHLGLLEARRRWRPERGVPFGAYATLRIRGAMIDGLRQLDPLTRSERSLARRGERVRQIEHEEADDDTLESEEVTVEARLCAAASRRELRQAVRLLPERERLAVEAHFFEGRQLKEVGASLGVSESRVCQLVSSGVTRLRQELRAAA